MGGGVVITALPVLIVDKEVLRGLYSSPAYTTKETSGGSERTERNQVTST